jgi:hypothetical protein
MAKNMFSKGFALAVLALSAIERADAFVVKPSGFHGTSTELSESPKFIKRGQKVETEVDFGILVQAVVRAHIIVTDRVFRYGLLSLEYAHPPLFLLGLLRSRCRRLGNPRFRPSKWRSSRNESPLH